MSENYLNNPLLKKAFTPIEYTKEQIEEYVKCAEDPVYFIRNYVKIINLDEGIINFNLRGYQEKFVNIMHNERFVITLQPRQAGKTNTSIAFLLHYVLFNEYKSVAILANKDANAKDFLARLKLAYENLPKWIQQGVLEWNKGTIVLENGSKVKSSATSSSAIRSGSYNIILLDELAFVPHNIQQEFFSSAYPTVSSGTTTKVIISSTPGGFEMFYKLWTDANKGINGYIPYRVTLDEVPGRDETWRKQTIAALGEDVFRREHLGEFIGSQHTLISSAKLTSLAYQEPIVSKDSLFIYSRPEPEHTYFMTVDVSHGKEQDFSTFTIFDITEYPFEQVAIFKDNQIAPLVFPDIIHKLATEYNQAFVLVEVNDIGTQVSDILYYDLEYENLLLAAVKGRAGQVLGDGFAKNTQFGVKTSKQVKRVGCNSLKHLIENDKIKINDFNTIAELSSFILKGGSYQAEEGKNDDLVMNLVIFSWAVTQNYFSDITGKNIKRKMFAQQLQEMEDDLVPFFVNDGEDEDSIWEAV